MYEDRFRNDPHVPPIALYGVDRDDAPLRLRTFGSYAGAVDWFRTQTAHAESGALALFASLAVAEDALERELGWAALTSAAFRTLIFEDARYRFHSGAEAPGVYRRGSRGLSAPKGEPGDVRPRPAGDAGTVEHLLEEVLNPERSEAKRLLAHAHRHMNSLWSTVERIGRRPTQDALRHAPTDIAEAEDALMRLRFLLAGLGQ